ncbi:MAG: TRAP transporter small permease [Maritimibacter sp.]|nr:TRAP transporter small permease [Maritimibacter sp.]
MIGLLALVAALLVVSESFIRFLAPAALPDWGAEMTVYLIGWAVMLSAARMVRDNMHVGVDLLTHSLSREKRLWFELFACVVGVVVSAVIIYAGIQMVEFAMRFHERGDSSIRFPMWLYYMAIPVGFALTAIQYVIRAVGLLSAREG